ncbi:MAG TPA: DUF6644 family protein [Gammaproteobacteria bacterium]|nr:DUF6644 family protein [Gammaproteobacteria bacterium]
MHDFAQWLDRTPPSVLIQSSLGLIRLLQAAHLLTAGVVCVSGLVIALRVLGVARRDEPFDAVWRRFAPWLAGGLAVMATTGLLQTLGDPVREFTSTSYWVKLASVVTAIAITAAFGQRLRVSGGAERFPVAAKLGAAGLVLLWLAIVLLGRMIAYDRAIWGALSLRT